MVKEKCVNCGCGIGALETPYVWEDRMVCRTCYAKLQPRSKKKQLAVLVCVVILVGIGLGTLRLTFRQKAASVPPAQQSAPYASGPTLPPAAVPPQISQVQSGQPAQGSAGRTSSPLVGTAPVRSGPQKIRATITGSVWVNRKNGASDLLRGVPIELWPAQVSGRGVIAALRINLQRAKEEAERSRKSAVQFRAEFGAGNQTAVDYDRRAAKAEAIVAELEKQIGSLPATISAPAAYGLVNRLTTIPGARGIMDPVGAESCILKARSGADGKFALTGELLPGRYYVRAAEMNSAFSIDWLVPVTVADETPVAVDLFNDNAIDVTNFTYR